MHAHLFGGTATFSLGALPNAIAQLSLGPPVRDNFRFVGDSEVIVSGYLDE